MHSVIAILLPLSLVMLVFGGICGLVSSLARSRTLLIGSASYFLLCSKFDPLNAMVTSVTHTVIKSKILVYMLPAKKVCQQKTQTSEMHSWVSIHYN